MSARPLSRTARRAAPLLLGATLALTACAPPDDDPSTEPTGTPSTATSPAEPEGTRSPKSTPKPEPKPEPGLEVTVKGSDVGPNAQQISMEVGEPLLIAFQADRAGELHVHSKPEQYVEFTPGRSTAELVIQTPGTVEVEEHDTGAVVAVLEVR